MAKKFKVVEAVVIASPQGSSTKTVKDNLSHGKAHELADKLNDKESVALFNPNRLVSYLVAPA